MRSVKLAAACSLALVLSGGLALRGGRQARVINRWVAESSMKDARSGACSALLADGRILVTGGLNDKDAQASAEIFDSSGTFSVTSPMFTARAGHVCVTLSDGRVLVAGGRTLGGGASNAAELFDPVAGSWSLASSMTEARAGATATMLTDGRLLIAGGETASGVPTASLEIYSPAADAFSGLQPVMSAPRKDHAAVDLRDGRVLIAGGSDGSAALDSMDLYDPRSGKVTRAASLSTARAGLSATRLLDMRVFLAGGSNGSNDLETTEIFDPKTGTVSPAASMSVRRRNHRALRIPDNNQVLIAGGTSGGVPEASAESFIPWENRFAALEPLPEGRTAATGSALKLSGKVMLAGGATAFGATSSTVTLSGPTVTTDKLDYAPGQTVTITGTGWQPGETVRLSFVENPPIDTHPDLFAVADSSGNIYNNQLVMNDLDAGVAFTLTATGLTSNLTASTMFTDDTNVTAATVTINESTCTTATPVFNQGQTVCATVVVTGVGGGGGVGNFFIIWFNPSSTVAQTTTKAVPASVPTTFTDTFLTTTASPTGTWTVSVCKTAACGGGNLVTSKTFTLNAPTTTSVSPSVNPSTYGTAVTFTATVTRTSGTGTPTGSVQFKIDGSNFGAAVALGAPTTSTSATAVSASISTLTATSHTVDAVYVPTGFLSASTGTVSQTVNQKALTVSFTAANKVYDGTTSATILTRSLTGVIAPDVVTAGGGTASFADKNVGTGKTVNASGFTLSGAAAGNYVISPNSAATTANITARALTVSATGVNRVYDGTTTATVTLSDDRVTGDVLTTNYTSASFATKTVGTSKAVTVTGITVTGTDSGNYTFNTTAATTANITSRTLAVTATASNKVYDGNATATVTLADNRVAGDVFTVSYTTATFSNKSAGTGKTVTVNGISISGADAGNYTPNTTTTATAEITQRALTISATGMNKVYDGTTAATVTLSDNRVTGDTLTLSYSSATFPDKNVGTAKAVSVSGISISGADSGNYTFNSTASATADITQRPLTVSATGVNKVYDGSTTATVTLSDNRVTGDSLTTSYTTATFNNKNVGTGKPVSVSGISISGTDSGNYSFNTTAATTANITQRPLTITATGVDRVYDGTTTATVTLSDDRVSGDVFTASYASAVFANKNAGSVKSISVTGISISGTDAGNYSFNSTASATANITQRSLTVTATGVDRVYDGTTTAMVHFADTRISGDTLTVAGSASFADKNVGAGKAVTVTGISISGTDSGNYLLANTTAATTASITQRPLAITATGVNKVYDGNATATVTLSDNRISGDSFTATYTSAAFTSKTVGTGKTVNVTGISISGADAGNYSFNTTASTTANITQRPLTITATGVDKIYDGTTTAAVTLSDDRVTGDVFTASYTTATFANKNAGTAKSISVTGISISGVDAGNYTFNTTATATANISQRPLTVTATGVDRVYDGTTAATVVFGDNRIAGDVLTVTDSANFADKNVGVGKAVTVTGISISGTDSGNYLLANTTAATTASITQRPLTISATGANKVYDGNANATVTLADNRVTGDVFTATYSSALFNSKNAGTGKPVNVTGISISGTDAGNYSFNTTASTTANISQRPLTIAATGVDRIYDGSTTATVTLSDDRVSLDVFTASYTSAHFADKHAGTSKPINVTGISITGPDAANYTFNTTASATANISQRPLTVTATGVDKIYDGTTAATVAFGDNRITGDNLTVTDSASFADKNVGAGKAVTVTGISISGPDSGNYSLASTTAATTASITQRALAITATGANKIYDGNANATVTLADNRIPGDVFTATYTSALFNNKNAGTGKPVNVTGISISGTDAGNYSFNTTAATTANITQRPLAVTATGVDKVYDGTTAATVTLADDRVAGDALAASYTSASFADKHAGNAKAINVTGISVSGTDSGNYSWNTTASATANISQRALTVAASGVHKVYDGTTAATVTFTDNRISGDVFTASGSAAFADKNVGMGKSVNVTGISLSGADSGNYTHNTTAMTTANITQRSLTVSATGVDKVYDGTTAATVTLSDDRVSGDTLTDTYTSAVFANKNVGTGKPITVSGIAISGADSGNYQLNNTTAATSASITMRALTVAATGVNKIYDGTTAATVTLSDNRVAGDVFTATYTAAAFIDAGAGLGKTINVAGISISGTDAGNYTFNTTAVAVANILPASTSTAVVTSNNPSLYGAPVTFTATVTPQFGGVPSGTVQFKDGAASLGAPVPVAAGGAAMMTSSLAVGSHSITAVYSGDTNFNGSTSAAVAESIGPSGLLKVKFSRHVLLDETAKPKVRTDNVGGAEVRVYTRRDACTDGQVVTAQPKIWGKIYDGLDGPPPAGTSDPGCPVVSLGSYVAKGITDANGEVSIVVPPTTSSPNTDYVIIGRTCIDSAVPNCDELDDPRTMADPDALYSGKQVNNIKSGEMRTVALKQLRMFNGKKVPAKYVEDYGSYLAIIEPEYMDWTSDVERYPFVLEAIEDWGVTTTVAPPEGFVSDYPALSAQVADTTSAIQFTLTDVGSDWTNTEVTHTVKHKGKTIVHKTKVPMFNKQKKDKDKDKDKEKGK